MLYKTTFTVPHAADEDTPGSYSGSLKVTEGTVTRLWVLMWAGAQGTTGIRILRAEDPIWPTSRGEWIALDEVPLISPEDYDIKGVPYEFQIEAYNEDTVNDHEVTVAVLVLRERTPSWVRYLVERLFGR